MRASRIFNGVERVDVEWTILGQRYRLPTMTLMVASLAAGIAAALAANAWVGGAVAAGIAAAVVYANWHLNQMDPDGVLRETTQVGMLWRAARRPYITNTGRH